MEPPLRAVDLLGHDGTKVRVVFGDHDSSVHLLGAHVHGREARDEFIRICHNLLADLQWDNRNRIINGKRDLPWTMRPTSAFRIEYIDVHWHEDSEPMLQVNIVVKVATRSRKGEFMGIRLARLDFTTVPLLATNLNLRHCPAEARNGDGPDRFELSDVHAALQFASLGAALDSCVQIPPEAVAMCVGKAIAIEASESWGPKCHWYKHVDDAEAVLACFDTATAAAEAVARWWPYEAITRSSFDSAVNALAC